VAAVKRICLGLSLVLLGANAAGAQTRVYLGENEAIARVLQGAGNISADTLRLSPAEIDDLSRGLNGVLVDSVYVFHEAIVGDTVSSRAVIVSSMGQYEPITFIVALRGSGEVERVEIMVYRESRGGEVRRRAFLEQFEGRSGADPIRLGDDIMHVTGATISSRAVANGVRLAFRLQERLRLRDERVSRPD
jgi:hypothetical protein